MTGYDEIISLPHPVSDRRLPMPMQRRAAQFAPFAALMGYDEAVQEAGRCTDRRLDVSEDRAETLNRRLCWLRDHICEFPEISATWFVPDEKKAGGAYRTVTDQAKRLDAHRRLLYLQCGTIVPLGELFELSGSCFDWHGV